MKNLRKLLRKKINAGETLFLIDDLGNQLYPTGQTPYPFMLLENDGSTEVALVSNAADVVSEWNGNSSLSTIGTLSDNGGNTFNLVLNSGQSAPDGVIGNYDYNRTVLEHNTFTNLDDFTIINTNGATNTVSGGVIEIRGGSTSTNTFDILQESAYGRTSLWTNKITMEFTCQDAGGSSSRKSIGVGCKNPGAGFGQPIWAVLPMDNTWGRGTLMLTDYSTYQENSAAITCNVGSNFRLELERVNGIVSATLTNLDTLESVSITNKTPIISFPNNRYITTTWFPAIVHTNGDADVSMLKMETTEGIYADLVLLGDGRMAGLYCMTGSGTYNDTIFGQLVANYPNRRIKNFTTSGDQTPIVSGQTVAYGTDILDRLLELKGRIYFYSGSIDDLTDNITVSVYGSAISTIKSAIEAQGGIIKFGNIMPYSAEDVQAHNTELNTQISPDTPLDFFTALKDGGFGWNAAYDCGDGTAPNNAGTDVVYGIIDAAGLIDNNIHPPS